MKGIYFFLAAAVFFLLMSTATDILYVNAQQSTPTTTPTPSANNNDLEQRIFQLETIINQYIAALKERNDTNQSLMTLFGVVISAIVSFLIIIQTKTYLREGKRESREADRDKNRDVTESAGAKQFSSLMSVVQQTLSDREARQARNDEAWTAASTMGVNDVSKVMNLVPADIKKPSGCRNKIS